MAGLDMRCGKARRGMGAPAVAVGGSPFGPAPAQVSRQRQ